MPAPKMLCQSGLRQVRVPLGPPRLQIAHHTAPCHGLLRWQRAWETLRTPLGSKNPPAAVVDGLYAAQTLHTGAPEAAIAPPPCVLRPQARRQLRPPQAGQCRVPQHAGCLLPVALCAGASRGQKSYGLI